MKTHDDPSGGSTRKGELSASQIPPTLTMPGGSPVKCVECGYVQEPGKSKHVVGSYLCLKQQVKLYKEIVGALQTHGRVLRSEAMLRRMPFADRAIDAWDEVIAKIP